MSEYDYKQRPVTKEYDEGWDRVFKKSEKKVVVYKLHGKKPSITDKRDKG